MFKKENTHRILNAWKRLLIAYLLSFAASTLIAHILVQFLDINPETIFEISTKRLSYAIPLFDAGSKMGIDSGILLFVWNAAGALATISFIYTVALLNPHKVDFFPQGIRKLFCGKTKMKLLCFLPGCLKIEEEAMRRAYVWLMVPLLGMILLGIESGLSASTASYIFDSYTIGFISMLPHGIIEIPTISLAGAVTFSAHLLLKEKVKSNMTAEIFSKIETYRKNIPIQAIAFSVIFCLFIAGLVEAHITQKIISNLAQ
ncbi:MAG: stage II sporulation protein M [Desulfobulbaceae bacterium]|uniref:Stage II sporulation protein M n=1 Tax=Candidatus Desulfobia pelagia TaxID=2841692 RepID=A0A8J6NDT8_9BACT|nr:stage II sporulation protein M [Candidatus Desulfobia pelagia]